MEDGPGATRRCRRGLSEATRWQTTKSAAEEIGRAPAQRAQRQPSRNVDGAARSVVVDLPADLAATDDGAVHVAVGLAGADRGEDVVQILRGHRLAGRAN